jgi:hypothetical protein
VWFVRAGTLDDPAHVTPDVHIYTRSKIRWINVPKGVPAYEAYYDPSQLWPSQSLRRLQAVGRCASR